MKAAKYNENVFINCPFDTAYKPLFDALIFAVFDCGFVARCALEEDDGSQIRVQKVFGIISQCRLSIHDLSRVEVDKSTKLPRFNMPLELGAFLGAKHFGGGGQKRKACLILDSERYRYQKFISDIAGQDIKAHENSPRAAIRIVRDWLRTYSQLSIPSGSVIWARYQVFENDLPPLCKELSLNPRELIFNDYVLLVSRWLKINT
ncbi:MAG: hypothetical protein QOE33_1621 [Acidobacteriota bacterium]|nr:hypothetical protein [Acidobacteriota bacterium]